MGKVVDWLKPDPSVRTAGSLLMLLFWAWAPTGVPAATLLYAWSCLWCHYNSGLFVLPPFLLGYALLCKARWREAIVVGVCCWAWLVWFWEAPQYDAASSPVDPFRVLYAIVGFVFASNAWILACWLWRLPLPRRSAACVIGSLALGTTLLLLPYWPYAVARFHGRGAHLRHANLAFADLRCADLRGADLRYANLRGASLDGADFTGADLTGADLKDAAYYSGTTRWPAGFSPESHGVLEYEFM